MPKKRFQCKRSIKQSDLESLPYPYKKILHPIVGAGSKPAPAINPEYCKRSFTSRCMMKRKRTSGEQSPVFEKAVFTPYEVKLPAIEATFSPAEATFWPIELRS